MVPIFQNNLTIQIFISLFGPRHPKTFSFIVTFLKTSELTMEILLCRANVLKFHVFNKALF